MFPVNGSQQFQQCVGSSGGQAGSLTTTYFGMALGANSRSIDIWNGILETCEKKFTRWKNQYLSLGVGVSNGWVALKLERLKWAELEIRLDHDPPKFTWAQDLVRY